MGIGGLEFGSGLTRFPGLVSSWHNNKTPADFYLILQYPSINVLLSYYNKYISSLESYYTTLDIYFILYVALGKLLQNAQSRWLWPLHWYPVNMTAVTALQWKVQSRARPYKTSGETENNLRFYATYMLWSQITIIHVSALKW